MRNYWIFAKYAKLLGKISLDFQFKWVYTITDNKGSVGQGMKRTKRLQWLDLKSKDTPPVFNKYGCEHFHRLENGDTRYRMTMYIRSFRTFRELYQRLSLDPYMLKHVLKNYQHYEPYLVKLKAAEEATQVEEVS